MVLLRARRPRSSLPPVPFVSDAEKLRGRTYILPLSGEDDEGREEEGDEREGSDSGEELLLEKLLLLEEDEQTSSDEGESEGDACER